MLSNESKQSFYAALVACFFLVAQFFIPLHIFTSIFEGLGWHAALLNDPDKKTAFESTVSGVAIIFSTWFGLVLSRRFFRRNIKPRFNLFLREVSNVTTYHLDQINLIERETSNGKSGAPKGPFDFIWVDFILTDIRKAMSELLGHKSVRVSLFVEHFDHVSSSTDFMVFAQSSSFRDRTPRPTKFSRGEGYCGWAWTTGKPVSGSSRKSFRGHYDEKYLHLPGQDHNLSFLCIPLFSRRDDGKAHCRGVLCIDSRDNKDLCLSETWMNEISFALDRLLSILTSHILSSRYILYDRRPLEIREE